MRRTVPTFLVFLVCVAFFSGCVKPAAPAKPARPPAIVHEVRYSGETLAIISGWYTGEPKNWKELASFNEGINPNKIQIGDQIEIPRYLLKRENPFSKEYIKKFSKSAKPVDGGAVSKPTTPETSDDGSVAPPSVENTSGDTSGGAPNGEVAVPPSEDGSEGDSSSSQPSEVGAGDAGSAALPEGDTGGAQAGQQPQGNGETDREALREKTRFELLEEILKGEEKAGGEAAPGAGSPQ